VTRPAEFAFLAQALAQSLSAATAVFARELDVTLTNGMLTVRGEKKTERDEQDKDKKLACGGTQLWLVQPCDPPAVRSRPGEDRGQVRQWRVAHPPAETAGGSEQAAKDRDQERVAPAGFVPRHQAHTRPQYQSKRTLRQGADVLLYAECRQKQRRGAHGRSSLDISHYLSTIEPAARHEAAIRERRPGQRADHSVGHDPGAL
jgi:hypothetical protein